MYYDEDGNEVFELSDMVSASFIDGPLKGEKDQSFFPLEIEGETQIDVPGPFEAAKWQNDPTRKTLVHRYRYDKSENGLFFVKSFEHYFPGFGIISINEDSMIESIEEIEPL